MPVTDAELESRQRELKSRWESLNTDNDAVISSAKSENGVLLIDNERRKSFQSNLAEMKAIREEIDMIAEQKRLREWGSQPAGDSAAMAAAAELAGKSGGFRRELDAKTIGQMFTESEEFKNLQRSKAATMASPWTIEGVDLGSKALWTPGERKDVYAGTPSGGPPLGFNPLFRDDIVVQAFRKVRVRDLFPVRPTTAAVIEFFQVTGFVSDNAASVVPQWDPSTGNFGLVPHTSLNFTGQQSPVRTIAHWEAAHRHVLDDVPQLQGIIDTELLYGLRLQEDYQLLSGGGDGTGSSEEITGILNTSGIQAYTRPAGNTTDTNADDVRRAATKAILAYYEPTGVVMHPTDWEGIETIKDSTGAYVVAIAVAVGGQQRLWRLPVVDTPAMTQGTFLVGSFGLGATLYDREEGTIRIAEQHSDFFLRNAIVVLAEERLAMAVKRPESFVKGSFGG